VNANFSNMDHHPESAIDLATITELYDCSLFLEAYQKTLDYWSPSTNIAALSTEELILGGRLARRLGGGRLSRWLYHRAYLREPLNPLVRYYTHHSHLRQRSPLKELWGLEEKPLLGTSDPKLEASWLAYQAAVWARLRDFGRADSCLQLARSYSERNGWVETCQSDVDALADRREDALLAAERAWEIDPGSPYAAQTLGHSLLNLGRVGEAAHRLAEAAAETQSYEVAHLACWFQCTLADTCEGAKRNEVLLIARTLADRLPSLAPLADRDTKSSIARTNLDIASLLGDRDEMKKSVEEVHSPFHRKVLANLLSCPGGARIRLSHVRTLQKHETCLPASLANSLSSQSVAIDPEEMAAEITYGGTPAWAAAEWLEKRGVVVRFFTVTPTNARELIKRGIAFVLALQSDESAHAMAVVGMDEAAGTLIIQDPSDFRTSECLLDGVEELRDPVGPLGIVALPQTSSHPLDGLLSESDVEVMTAIQMHRRETQTNGPTAAGKLVKDLARKFPENWSVQYLRAIQAAGEGRSGEALVGLQECMKAFPRSAEIRRRLLDACHSIGNTALSRKVLEGVVDSGIVPGIESRQSWSHPPPSYTCQFADLLGQSAASRGKARKLLEIVLRRDRSHALAWHCLGDLLLREGDSASPLLSLRLASCLASSDEHYALAYSDALCDAGRKEEGFQWLETRARQLGPKSTATHPWKSWIHALEDWGFPERAMAAFSEALGRFGETPEFLVFAIPFLARMNRWEEAEHRLQVLQASGNVSLFSEAAREYWAMRGDLERATQHAADKVDAIPLDIAARRRLLSLISRHKGPKAASLLAAQWVRDFPEHDGFEELYCGLEESTIPRWREERRLHRRVKRNPEDGWAWRELVFRRIADYERGGERRRSKLGPKIEQLLAECYRTAPESPATACAHGLWHEACGEWTAAIRQWLTAIDVEPNNFYSYRRLWNCSARLESTERLSLLRQIEPRLLGLPAHLSFAREMSFLLAERLGVVIAEQAVERWMSKRPDDPDVVLARASLLLNYGHGQSDAGRARAILEAAVHRFPDHIGLQLSLAEAYQQNGRYDETGGVLNEILRRHPDDARALVQKALVLERCGKEQEALRLLETAETRDPWNTTLWNAHVQMFIRLHRYSDGQALIKRVLDRMPESVSWRERSISLLLECRANEDAVATAREGTRLHPTGASMWLLLATTLKRTGGYAMHGEIERCLRRSLHLNAAQYESADSLSILLVEQGRLDEAAQVIEQIMPRLDDPTPAQGRLAWIRYQRGQKTPALNELVAALEGSPWFRWGWDVCMAWLAEQSDWETARNLLRVSPAQFNHDSGFRRMRLQILSKAGLSQEQLQAEWDELLRDFPEDVSLHLHRYDDLRASKSRQEAAEVLRAAYSFAPENPYLLARLEEVLIEDGKREEAIECLLRVWFAKSEESPWPVDHSWAIAQRHRFDQEARLKAQEKLTSGAKPTPQALYIMAKDAMLEEITPAGGVQPEWRNWIPRRGARMVLSMLDCLDHAPRDVGKLRAILLSQLVDQGYCQRVLRYRNKHQSQVDSETESWAQIGRALISAGRKQEARKYLAEWRQRNGVAMWVVACYVSCFSKADRELSIECFSACQAALSGIPHDHCAKYLSHVQAEMCALRGDIQSFRKTWSRYRAHFTGERSESEWFEAKSVHLLQKIPELAEIAEQNRAQFFLKKCEELRRQKDTEPSRPTVRSNSPLSIPWWVWWIIFMLLSQPFINR
jgi:tetratricopeptide (TPR) repeat protein